MQIRGPGNTHREVTYLSWATPPYAYACGSVIAYADKRLTLSNTYAHPTDQPILIYYYYCYYTMPSK